MTSADQGGGVLPQITPGKMAWIATAVNVLTLHVNRYRNVGMGHPKCSGWHLPQIDDARGRGGGAALELKPPPLPRGCRGHPHGQEGMGRAGGL